MSVSVYSKPGCYMERGTLNLGYDFLRGRGMRYFSRKHTISSWVNIPFAKLKKKLCLVVVKSRFQNPNFCKENI